MQRKQNYSEAKYGNGNIITEKPNELTIYKKRCEESKKDLR